MHSAHSSEFFFTLGLSKLGRIDSKSPKDLRRRWWILVKLQEEIVNIFAWIFSAAPKLAKIQMFSTPCWSVTSHGLSFLNPYDFNANKFTVFGNFPITLINLVEICSGSIGCAIAGANCIACSTIGTKIVHLPFLECRNYLCYTPYD